MPNFSSARWPGRLSDAGDRHHAIEAGDVEGEGERGAAEFRPIALALRVRGEGEAQRDAVVAVMDAQAAQADQSPACPFAGRPASEAQGGPFGRVIRHQGVALGARQHAVLEKIHHPRIGMQNGQPVGVGQGDGIEMKSLGERW